MGEIFQHRDCGKMISRFFICLLVLSVSFASTCFVGYAALPQVCIEAEKHKNIKIRKNLYTQCIVSGQLSDYNSSIFYAKRGIINEYLHEYDLAIRDYSRSIERNPQLYGAYIRRGVIYHNLGEFQKAIQDFEKAIELRPNNKQAFNNLAWLLATCKDIQYRDGQRALELIETAMQLSSVDDHQILDTLGAVYAELGQFDKARDVQSRAIKIAEEKGETELSIILREALADYEKNRKHH